MLGFIRKHRNMFMILFVLCGLALIISLGLPGLRGGRNSSGGNPFGGYVAKVGDQEVTARELGEEIQRRDEQIKKMFGAQFGNNDQGKQILENIRHAQLNPTRVLDELLQRKILLHLFDKQGLEVSKGAVKNEIEHSPYFLKDGVFDPKLYRERVSYPAQFEGYLRDQLKSSLVLEPVAFGGSLLTNDELDIQKKLAVKRDFEELAVSPDSIKQAVNVSDAEIKNALNDPKVAPDLQAYFNRNIKNYNRPEEISARHILIKDEDGGEKKIKEIAEEIHSGKISFINAAKKYSKDPSNAPKGGDLGFFGRGVMDKAFEDAAFALSKKDEISAPVKSSFGWHLIQFEDRHEAINKNFADIKNEVAKAYLVEKKKLDQVKSTVEAWAKAGGPKAAELKSMGLSWAKLTAWDVGQARLGQFAETDVKPAELLALKKDKPLLQHAIQNAHGWSLVRFTGEKTDPVDPSKLAFQKSTRVLDLYFDRYRKSLEYDKEIVKSDKQLTAVKQAFAL